MNKIDKLNFDSVPSLWAKRESLFKENTVDLKDISSIDVSGMAILVKWAKAQKIKSYILSMYL